MMKAMLWGILLAGTALLTACHSTQDSGSGGFASVTITNRSPSEIRLATTQVFQADGYELSSLGDMVFEKQGSRMNQLAYGGLIATQENDRTWVRVRVSIVDLGPGAQRLQCQAFFVPHRGDSFFEEERRVYNIQRGPYQDLLNQVKDQLHKP
jgi:hypothetical protein